MRDKVKKSKWTKPRKPTARPPRRLERAAGWPASSSYMSLALKVVIARLWCLQRPRDLPGKAPLPGESQRGTIITLALRPPERLRLGLDLIPRVSPPRESEPAWQLPASTAPPSLGQADARPNRRRQCTIRYKESRKDRYTGSVGLSQPRM